MQKLTKKIIINAGIYENRAAVLENGKLEEFYVEQEGTAQLFGNIYKGVIESVVPGIGAAFVNIGTGKNAFLFIADIQEHKLGILDEADDDFIVEQNKEKKSGDISKLIKVGQELMVQVEKEPMGTKGPRVTTNISLPGRYIVLTPFEDSVGISKRINDPEERNRIKDILKSVKLPPGAGCIVRTAARGMSQHSFKREVRYLVNLWMRVQFRTKKIKTPALLYEEYGLILRVIRDQFTENVEQVVVDSKEEYKKIVRFLNYFMPDLKARLSFYNGKESVFEKYGIEKEIEKLFEKKISLRSGGSIVIEQTEGMVAIDVNTEKYRGKRDVEDTVFKTNMEAAREIARQIRLRDIGGIIIIDFIDMRSREHRIRVQDILETLLRKDKAKTKILNISPIGVVEMTRQRMRKSFESSFYKKCPYCNGRGLIKSETTIAVQLLRKIESASHLTRARHLDVWVNPQIYSYLEKNEKDILVPLRRKCRKHINLHKDEHMHMEDVRII